MLHTIHPQTCIARASIRPRSFLTWILRFQGAPRPSLAMKSGKTGSFFIILINFRVVSTPYFNLKGIALFLMTIVCSLSNVHEVRMCNKFFERSNDVKLLVFEDIVVKYSAIFQMTNAEMFIWIFDGVLLSSAIVCLLKTFIQILELIILVLHIGSVKYKNFKVCWNIIWLVIIHFILF